jgi:hypothetical protein
MRRFANAINDPSPKLGEGCVDLASEESLVGAGLGVAPSCEHRVELKRFAPTPTFPGSGEGKQEYSLQHDFIC